MSAIKSKSARGRPVVVSAVLLTFGCAQTVDELGADGVAPAVVSWYLPVTEAVNVKVTTEIQSCAPLVIGVRTEATPVVVTDWANRRSAVIGALGGAFGTAELTADSWPEGMVKSLGGKSEDRFGPTAIAVVETVLKLAAAGFFGAEAEGRPSARRPACTQSARTNSALLADALRSMNETSLDDKALSSRTAQVERLRATLRSERVIRLAFEGAPLASPILPRVEPLTGAGLVEAKLLTADPWTDPPRLTISLAYTAGSAPAARLADVDADYHYREPVRMVLGLDVQCQPSSNCDVRPSSRVMHFGVAQWGVPRRLPIRVGLFQSVSFSIGFQQDGTPTTQRGSTAAAPAEGAALFARTLATDLASDPETAALKAKASRVQAELDLMQARAKLEAARAAR